MWVRRGGCFEKEKGLGFFSFICRAKRAKKSGGTSLKAWYITFAIDTEELGDGALDFLRLSSIL
jgi:hypothetical protein